MILNSITGTAILSVLGLRGIVSLSPVGFGGDTLNTLFDPVRYVKGVGPQRERHLQRLGISDVYDLLWHIPRSYIDRTETVKIRNLLVGEVVSITGIIETVRTWSVLAVLLLLRR